MAQPDRSQKTPLAINIFWEKTSSESPLRWEKWRTENKFEILAKEGISQDVLLKPKPTTVTIPTEPR